MSPEDCIPLVGIRHSSRDRFQSNGSDDVFAELQFVVDDDLCAMRAL